MAKIISSAYLNKKLTGDRLRSQVGNIQINSGNSPKTLGGAVLKKFIGSKLGGKTDTQIEKILKDKYGVSGYQLKKRESIMKLIRGDEKSGLTEEQVKKNLKINKQRDESGLTKQEYKTSFAGGRISTKSIGAKSTMEEIGVKRGATGFAQNYHNTKLPGNPAPKPPSTGIRPLGL